MACAALSHALLPGCDLGGLSGSQILMFLQREGVENTEVYGGVNVAGTNFHLLLFLGLVCFVSELRSVRSHCKFPGLVAFMGEKAVVLEVLAVAMSLSCTSPQVSLCVSLPSGPHWCHSTLRDGRTAELEVRWISFPPEQLFLFPKSCTLTPCSSSRMLGMNRGLDSVFPPKPSVCAPCWRIAHNLLLQVLELLQTLGWGHPGWGARRRWGRAGLCTGILVQILHAQALPPPPPQHWHLLCRFLLLSLPTSPGLASPVLQQRGGAASSPWHIRVSPIPCPFTPIPVCH